MKKEINSGKIKLAENIKVMPLFIYGYMHSGTSLLFHILSSCIEINSFKKEIKLLDKLPSLSRRYLDLNSKEEKIDFFRTTINFNNEDYDFKDLVLTSDNDIIIDYFNFWKHISLNKKYYLEGSPNNYLFDNLLSSKLDCDTRGIAIFRDPRDVIASKKKRWQTTNSSRYKPQKLKIKKNEKGYSAIWDSLSIKKTFQKISELEEKKRLIIRYEDLTNDYDREIKKIGKYLEIDTKMFVSRSNITFSNRANLKDQKKGLYQNSNYQKILSKDEIFIIQLICKEEMISSGYKLESIDFFTRLVSLKFLIFVFSDLIIRMYKRFMLLGYKDFINYFKLGLRKIN